MKVSAFKIEAGGFLNGNHSSLNMCNKKYPGKDIRNFCDLSHISLIPKQQYTGKGFINLGQESIRKHFLDSPQTGP